MKAKQITYSKLINTGNYEHSKIEITLEIEEGESAYDVLHAAKEFVRIAGEAEKVKDYQIENANRILENREDSTLRQVREAEETIKRAKLADSDLPF